MYSSWLEQLFSEKFLLIAILLVLVGILVVLILRLLHWRKANENSELTIVAAAELKKAAAELRAAAAEHGESVEATGQFLEGQLSIVDGEVQKVVKYMRLALEAGPQHRALTHTLRQQPMTVPAHASEQPAACWTPPQNGHVAVSHARPQAITEARPTPHRLREEADAVPNTNIPLRQVGRPESDEAPDLGDRVSTTEEPPTQSDEPADWFDVPPIQERLSGDVGAPADSPLPPAEAEDVLEVSAGAEHELAQQTDSDAESVEPAQTDVNDVEMKTADPDVPPFQVPPSLPPNFGEITVRLYRDRSTLFKEDETFTGLTPVNPDEPPGDSSHTE